MLHQAQRQEYSRQHRQAVREGRSHRSNGKKPPAKMKSVTCKRCGDSFMLRESYWKRCQRINPNRGTFCSYSCSNKFRAARLAESLIKRQPGWTHEQWEWEKKLAGMGLSMGVGNNPHELVHGQEFLWDSKEDY